MCNAAVPCNDRVFPTEITGPAAWQATQTDTSCAANDAVPTGTGTCTSILLDYLRTVLLDTSVAVFLFMLCVCTHSSWQVHSSMVTSGAGEVLLFQFRSSAAGRWCSHGGRASGVMAHTLRAEAQGAQCRGITASAAAAASPAGSEVTVRGPSACRQPLARAGACLQSKCRSAAGRASLSFPFHCAKFCPSCEGETPHLAANATVAGVLPQQAQEDDAEGVADGAHQRPWSVTHTHSDFTHDVYMQS
jgi:hypothetical protein